MIPLCSHLGFLLPCHFNGAVVVVDWFSKCIFASESDIARVFLLGEFGGLPIQFIKLILGLIISILSIIAPNHHLHPFFFRQVASCNKLPPCGMFSWPSRFTSVSKMYTADPTVVLSVGLCWFIFC